MGKIEKMVDYAVKIARDDSHGYSQVRRWKEQGTDRDCASLMYDAADHAGYNVGEGPDRVRYTGTMLADFKRAGFKALPFDGNLSDLEKGDILLNVEHHTEMYIGGGQFVGAHIAETGDTDGEPGDQTGNEISVCRAYIPEYGWDYVLTPPKEGNTVKWTDGDYITTGTINVYAARKAQSTLCCRIAKGTTVKLGKFATNSIGNVWAQVLAGDHKGRFVCVKNANGAYAKRK